MNRELTLNSIRFFTLVLLQVLICNHINFFGYVNPYIYILFIIFFPVKNYRFALILLSFLLGIVVDMFLDSGGIHAAACVFIAYVRPLFLKFCFGTVYEHQTVKFSTIEIGTKFTYIALVTVLHHIILFSLEIFNISKIVFIVQKTFYSSIFTILLSVLLTIIFSRKAT